MASMSIFVTNDMDNGGDDDEDEDDERSSALVSVSCLSSAGRDVGWKNP